MAMTEEQARQLVSSGQLKPETYQLAKARGLFNQPAFDPLAQATPMSPTIGQQMTNAVQANGVPVVPGAAQDIGAAMMAKKDPGASMFDGASPQAAAAPIPSMLRTDPSAPAPATSPGLPGIETPKIEGDFRPQQPQGPKVPQVDMLGMATKGIGMQEAGIKKGAEIGAEIGAEKVKAFQGLQGQLEKAQVDMAAATKERQDAFKAGTEKYQSISEEIKNTKVDPNRFWHNMSTGNKIVAALSMAFGALGSGLTGQKNTAMDIINSAIDRDIQGQLQARETLKESAQNQSNLINITSKFYDDRQSQILAAKGLALEQAQQQINMIGAKYEGPLANAKKLELIGNIEQQKAQTVGQLGFLQYQRTMFMQGGQGKPGGMQLAKGSMPPMDLKEFSERGVPNLGIAATPEDAKEIKTYMAGSDPFKDELQRLIAFRKEHGPTIVSRDVVARGKVLAGNLQNAYRQAEQMGVYKAGEQEFVQNLIPDDPTSFSVVLPKLEEIQKIHNRKEAAFLKSKGFSPPSSVNYDYGAGAGNK